MTASSHASAAGPAPCLNDPVTGPFWGGFLASPRPDPRVLQSLVAAFVALDVVVRALAGHGYAAESWPARGLGIVAAATVVVFLVPWQRVPLPALAVLPVVDVAALGLTRLAPEDGGPSIVALLPAVWLARQFGRRGVLVAVVSVALLQSVPGLVYRGFDGMSVSRAVLLPLVTGVAAMAVAIGLETLRSRAREVEERGRLLERALAQTRHEQQLNQTILDTVDVGLVLLGPDGEYRAVNRFHARGARLAFPQGNVGRAGQRGQVYAEDGTTLLGEEDMPTYRATRGEELEDRRIWIGDDPATRRALSVSARCLRDERGEPAGAVLAYKDVTDLLGALQVKDQFVATVSHELRTPLTSIIGYVDLLREREDLDPQAARQLDVVHRNGGRLLALVDDLLHTAQLAGGRAQLSLERWDLAELVRDAVAAAQPVATAAGVSVEGRAGERLTALVDRERIGQVLDNLLGNAVKYNRPGGAVTVLLDRERDGVRLEVADTGPGMQPEERQRLFTRFYRGRQAIDHAIPGAGLGLSICKAIVEAHEGRISLTSEIDVGTTVRVRLPVGLSVVGADEGAVGGAAENADRDRDEAADRDRDEAADRAAASVQRDLPA